MNIRLHIDRVVLDGFSLTPRQRATLTRSVTNELTRLLQSGETRLTPGMGTALPTIRAEAVTMTSPMDPASFGRNLARSLLRGVERQGR